MQRLPIACGEWARTALVLASLCFSLLLPLATDAAWAAPRTLRVSGMRSAPTDGASLVGAPSRDARFVAFQSAAPGLALGRSLISNVYLRDIRGGSVRPVSVGLLGGPTDGFSGTPSVDSSGRFVAYATSATNVVAGDANDSLDVMVWDGLTGKTVCASVNATGVPAHGDSFAPAISGNGRFVAFLSRADDLVAGDAAGRADVFLRDLQTGVTTRVSVGLGGVDANGDAGAPAISADGGRIAFSSAASNLVAGDTNNQTDVFLYDATAKTISRVNLTTRGSQARVGAYGPSISGNGRRVAFESISDQLVAGDRNGVRDVLVRDIAGRYTLRASVGPRGVAANRESSGASLSYDGRRVAFRSNATNLVARDTNNRADVFVRDLSRGTTTRVSVGAKGVQSTGSSGECAMAADGAHVVFGSSAANLVAADRNGMADVFVSSFGARGYARLSVRSGWETGIACTTALGSTPATVSVVFAETSWNDGLLAASLAGAARADVYAIPGASVPATLAARLQSAGVRRVYVVGAGSAVSQGAQDALAGLAGAPEVIALSGADRYALASRVASECVALRGARFDGTVFVVSATDSNESLPAVTYAAAKGRPFVFANASAGSVEVPAGARRVVILGGTRSVSSRVESWLRGRLGYAAVTRIYGIDRYATWAKVAEWSTANAGLEWGTVTVSDARRPVQAICAGAAAGSSGMSQVLVNPTSLPTASARTLALHSPATDRVHVAGDRAAVSDTVLGAIRTAVGR